MRNDLPIQPALLRRNTNANALPGLLKLAISTALLTTLLACSKPSTVRVTPAAPVSDTAKSAMADSTALRMADAEVPKVFALDLLQPSMLSGEQFQVAPELRFQGHQAEFLIKSDYGRLDAVSVEIAEQRIHEISALAELERMSELKVFGKAAATSLKRTGTALYNVFRDPEATAKAIPEGIRSKISSTWDNIKLKGKELSDDARGKIRGEEAPPEFNAFLPDPPTSAEKTWEDRAQSQGRKFGLSYIGYNSARRELTKTLEVDPYTSNPQIEDRLDAFAWSYLAGGKATGLTLGAITGGASFVVSRARKINSIVYDLPPEDVRKRNANELKKIGIDGDVARNFLRNSIFTPTLQTEIVDAITQNWTANGWKDLLSYLRYVDSELEARFIVNAMRIAQQQHLNQPAVTGVMLVGVTPVFELADGRVLVPAPVDYLHLNAKFRAFLGEPQLREKRVRLDVSGKVSALAAEQIQTRGWELSRNVRFQGAPNYALEEAEPVEMALPVPQDVPQLDGTFNSQETLPPSQPTEDGEQR